MSYLKNFLIGKKTSRLRFQQIQTFKKVKKAQVYIAAGGLYELYINGQRVGDLLKFASEKEL